MSIYKHPLTSHILVFIQMSGIALSCIPVGLKNSGSFYWLILCALGIILGITTLFYNQIGNFSVYPEPKPQARLITSGPYRYVRHPMYVSLILMMGGIALFNYHELNFIGLAMVILAVICKANTEETLLSNKFVGYSTYQQQTKRFIPGLY